jgi:Ca2+-binding RTX toxin-like protein
MADTTKPILTSLTFPALYDVSLGDRPSSWTATAFDGESGINEVLIWLDRPIITSLGSYSLIGLFGSSDSWADGQSTYTYPVSQWNALGTFEIREVVVRDNAGNSYTYTPPELSALGILTSFEIIGDGYRPTNGSDNLTGTATLDALHGYLGNDTISGLGGNDRLFGDAGTDLILGGDGADQLDGGTDNDDLRGDSGDDTLTGGAGDDLIFGGVGTDSALFSGQRAEYRIFENLDGTITVSDLVLGRDGTDILNSVEAIRFLDRKVTRDTIMEVTHPLPWQQITEDTPFSFRVPAGTFSEEGPHIRFSVVSGDGTPLSDWINFDPASQTFWGAPPRDFTGSVYLKVAATNGQQTVSTTLTVLVNGVNDAPSKIEMPWGFATENTFDGDYVGYLNVHDPEDITPTLTLIDDAGGRFKLIGNTVYVANGHLLDYEQASSHTIVVRATDGQGATFDQAIQISVADTWSERVSGTAGSDRISGGVGTDNLSSGSGNDYLYGQGGNDTLSGGAGDDMLFGGIGRDNLTGGKGRDAFVFDTKPSKSNIDKVQDFSVKDDVIQLSRIAFSKVGKAGWLSSGAIHKGAAAHDKSDRIIYDSSKGAVYYDADGIGSKAAIQIASISKGLKMTQKDFFIL